MTAEDTRKQRRHWCATVWTKHCDNLGVESFDEWWEHLLKQPNLRYAVGQIERSSDGKLHIQAYTEWTKSLRLQEIVGRANAHWEFRRGSRSEARDYCRLAVYHGESKGKLRSLSEFGEWRPEGTVSEDLTPKQRALSYLRKGMSPKQIAKEYPDVFFTHHRAILETFRISGGIFIPQDSQEEE